jgi:antitoxin component of MazEF toxin-antitoxin module
LAAHSARRVNLDTAPVVAVTGASLGVASRLAAFQRFRAGVGVAIRLYSLATREESDMQRLTRWGNSTGVRLPSSVMEAAGLKVGDYCYIRLLDSGDIRIRPVRAAIPAEQVAEKKDKVVPW